MGVLRQAGTYPDIAEYQTDCLKSLVERVYKNSSYYRNKFQQIGLQPGDIKTLGDLVRIPFTTKDELRQGYPLKMMAVDEKQVVRIHSSSGTTGKPVIIPYTQRDVDNWADMMARCMLMAGVTNTDRVQITTGYGLWTAGLGFQAGAEKIGAMVIPTGPGNTAKQIEMMIDMQTTVLICTSSYALLLAEKINQLGIRNKLALRLGIIGSERWGAKMRTRIEKNLGIKSYDIYGLTEIYGPGIAIDCAEHNGLHYWDDHLLFEIIDPVTGEQLPPGEQGELVITTLTKEGLPLLRYRTRDISHLKTSHCNCHSPYPLMARVTGRSDDMVKVKGVNIYPGQIDHVLRETAGASSEYQLILTRELGKDQLTVYLEVAEGFALQEVAANCKRVFKNKIGIKVAIEAVPLGQLPRSEKKTRRIYDWREETIQ